MAAVKNDKGCRYCGALTVHGGGCPHSPHGKHERVPTNSKACVFCGIKSYGRGCLFSPNGVHEHGSGDNCCKWCGSKSLGKGCPYSPTGVHTR